MRFGMWRWSHRNELSRPNIWGFVLPQRYKFHKLTVSINRCCLRVAFVCVSVHIYIQSSWAIISQAQRESSNHRDCWLITWPIFAPINQVANWIIRSDPIDSIMAKNKRQMISFFGRIAPELSLPFQYRELLLGQQFSYYEIEMQTFSAFVNIKHSWW